MPVTIPEAFPDWLVTCVGGYFPDCDEDAMRREGDQWSDNAESCRALAKRHDVAAAAERAALNGSTGDTKSTRNMQLGDDLRNQADYADIMAEQCYQKANDVEFTKLQVIGTGFALLAQLAVDVWLAAPGIAKAAEDRAAAEASWTAAARKHHGKIKNVGLQCASRRRGLPLAKATAIGLALGAGTGAAVNAGAQYYQKEVLHHRTKLEWDLVEDAAIIGGVAGGVGARFASRVAPGINRFLGRLAGTSQSNVARYGAHITAGVLIGGVGGATGAVAGVVASIPVTGHIPKGDEMRTAVLHGFVGGFVGSASIFARPLPPRATAATTTPNSSNSDASIPPQSTTPASGVLPHPDSILLGTTSQTPPTGPHPGTTPPAIPPGATPPRTPSDGPRPPTTPPRSPDTTEPTSGDRTDGEPVEWSTDDPPPPEPQTDEPDANQPTRTPRQPEQGNTPPDHTPGEGEPGGQPKAPPHTEETTPERPQTDEPDNHPRPDKYENPPTRIPPHPEGNTPLNPKPDTETTPTSNDPWVLQPRPHGQEDTTLDGTGGTNLSGPHRTVSSHPDDPASAGPHEETPPPPVDAPDASAPLPWITDPAPTPFELIEAKYPGLLESIATEYPGLVQRHGPEDYSIDAQSGTFDHLHQTMPNLSFSELRAVHDFLWADSTNSPAYESLDAFLNEVWQNRERLGSWEDVYVRYHAVQEPNAPSDPRAYIKEIGDIRRARERGNRIAYLEGGPEQDIRPRNSSRLKPDQAEYIQFRRAGSQGDATGFAVFVNPRADAAPALMRDIVHEIVDNPDHFPGVHSAKVAGPGRLAADGIVIHLNDRHHADSVVNWLRDYHSRATSNPDQPPPFLWDTPPMADPVMEGVAFGESDPHGEYSFGELRSRLIFQGLESADASVSYSTFRLAAIRYLESGGMDNYLMPYRYRTPTD